MLKLKIILIIPLFISCLNSKILNNNTKNFYLENYLLNDTYSKNIKLSLSNNSFSYCNNNCNASNIEYKNTNIEYFIKTATFKEIDFYLNEIDINYKKLNKQVEEYMYVLNLDNTKHKKVYNNKILNYIIKNIYEIKINNILVELPLLRKKEKIIKELTFSIKDKQINIKGFKPIIIFKYLKKLLRNKRELVKNSKIINYLDKMPKIVKLDKQIEIIKGIEYKIEVNQKFKNFKIIYKDKENFSIIEENNIKYDKKSNGILKIIETEKKEEQETYNFVNNKLNQIINQIIKDLEYINYDNRNINPDYDNNNT